MISAIHLTHSCLPNTRLHATWLGIVDTLRQQCSELSAGVLVHWKECFLSTSGAVYKTEAYCLHCTVVKSVNNNKEAGASPCKERQQTTVPGLVSMVVRMRWSSHSQVSLVSVDYQPPKDAPVTIVRLPPRAQAGTRLPAAANTLDDCTMHCKH